MQGWLPIVLQVVSGAIGAYLAAKAKKEVSLGAVATPVTGAIGGVGLGQLLPLILPALGGASGGGSPDLGGIIGSIGGGGVGGAVLTGVVGLIKNAMAKK